MRISLPRASCEFRRGVERATAIYEQLIVSAQRWGKVPAGKRIVSRRDKGELVIRLDDAIEGTDVEARPVPVPKRVNRLNQVARRFRDTAEQHEVSKATVPRAVRIVHALAEEAQRRGFECTHVEATLDQYGRRTWSGGSDGHLQIRVRDHRYVLRITEEGVPSRTWWERENRYRSWQRGERASPKRYDADATGRLKIALLAGYAREGLALSWADRNSWTLEDKLPDLLRELEIRAAEDDHRQRETERAVEERQRLWELEMERAKVRYAEAYRATQLREHVARWRHVQDGRAYLAALRDKYGDEDSTSEWIDWVASYTEVQDPLQSAPQMPDVPEPSPEDLKPFLRGLSPYGPSAF